MPKQNSSRLDSIEQYVIDKVRELREEKGWSQEDLAFELDVSRSFIGDVETPHRIAKYNLKHINKLAEIFNCSPQDFLPEWPLK